MRRPYSKRYIGEFAELAALDIGNSAVLKKPDDTTPTEFRRRVTNAVSHLSRSRGCRFETRTSLRTGNIVVRRIHTDAELSGGPKGPAGAMGF